MTEFDPFDYITKEQVGDLFIMRTRGLLASMLSKHCTQQMTGPAPHLLELMNGPEENLTVRAIAEFAFECGFTLDFHAEAIPRPVKAGPEYEAEAAEARGDV